MFLARRQDGPVPGVPPWKRLRRKLMGTVVVAMVHDEGVSDKPMTDLVYLFRAVGCPYWPARSGLARRAGIADAMGIKLRAATRSADGAGSSARDLAGGRRDGIWRQIVCDRTGGIVRPNRRLGGGTHWKRPRGVAFRTRLIGMEHPWRRWSSAARISSLVFGLPALAMQSS